VRLLAFALAGDPQRPRLGRRNADGVHDLTDALGSDLGTLIVSGVDPGDAAGPLVDPAEMALLAPLPRPGKIICVGLNYHDHCREQGIDPPAYPILFSKFANAVAHPGQVVVRPRATDRLDLECELGVVIGRRAKSVGREAAMEHVFGYTVVNDVTMRDLQREDSQWLRAKGSDGFAPMGPEVVTRDEIADPQRLGVRSSVNGETWQDSSTSEMVFDVATLVAFASRTITLEPGDLIATGTPAGVGHFQDPPRYLHDGDVMRCEIDGIGAIENRVADEQPRIDDHAVAAGLG
jgi:2-keto-4-pentenoate hydratase/2-oxohepta-3-ene-1,7-dioic acid hydratase in catechol pathway